MNHKNEDFLRSQLEPILSSSSHAVIISAHSLATREAVSEFLKTEHTGQTTILTAEGASIKMSQIRALYSGTAHKKRGRGQLVIIREADQMSEPAQNALLKLLEEPPDNTFFVLLARSMSALLPTIRSRSQSHQLKGFSRGEFIERWGGDRPEDEIEQLFAISGGDPIAAQALGKDLFALQAKELLSLGQFDGLCRLNTINPTKADAARLIEATSLIASHSFKSAKTQNAVQRWADLAELSLTSQALIANNGSPKLILARLLLSARRSPIM